ncbi:MAG: hypothetical protein CL961_02665, partial [Euryarchaeota archaeon]|nr:hypothetical protein [Euryarchaeota archaeon]
QMLDVPDLETNQKTMDSSINVPLPSLETNVVIEQATPDLPDLPDVAQIEDTTVDKLPSMTDIDALLNDIPVPKNPASESLPDLSELDDFLSDENSDISTPELPNLDDLF